MQGRGRIKRKEISSVVGNKVGPRCCPTMANHARLLFILEKESGSGLSDHENAECCELCSTVSLETLWYFYNMQREVCRKSHLHTTDWGNLVFWDQCINFDVLSMP